MSLDSLFDMDTVLEGTNVPDLDAIIQAAVTNEDTLVGDEQAYDQLLLPLFPKYRIFSLMGLISSRQVIVEQADVLHGRVDMQGVRWHEGERGRSAYKAHRDRTSIARRMFYDASVPTQPDRKTLDYDNNEFFRFRYTDTSIHCSHRHPQLRNLVYATSKNDVYYLYENAVQQWSPQMRASRTVLGPPLRGSYGRVPDRISTMAAMDQYLLTGGEDGSFAFMNLETCDRPVCDMFVDGLHMEVNSIEMSYARSGAPHAFISTNDCEVRCMDLKTLTNISTFPTEWYVNYTAQSPDRHMIGLVGDANEGHVMSVDSREVIATLKGHQGFSFSCAWAPNSTMLATGSDDCSTCIYDARNWSEPVHILGSDFQDSVRALRYSSCGRYLVMAEEKDVVHIVDTSASSDYTRAQKFEFIGDVSGISLTPDGQSLYVGVSAVEFSSILEFERLENGASAMDQDDPWSSCYF